MVAGSQDTRPIQAGTSFLPQHHEDSTKGDGFVAPTSVDPGAGTVIRVDNMFINGAEMTEGNMMGK